MAKVNLPEQLVLKQLGVVKKMKSRTGLRMDENQQREVVEKYIELRKTMTIREARANLGNIAIDTIYKWSNKFGLGDKVRPGHQKGPTRKYKPRPQLIQVPVDTGEPLVGSQPRQQAKTPGNIVVIMGDPESVKSALQTAFNVVTHR